MFLNDTHELDLITMTWHRVAEDGIKPSARSFHAACLSPDQSQILIYGGIDSECNVLQDMWAFSPEQRKWTQLSQSGSGPGKRSAHVMFRRGSDVFKVLAPMDQPKKIFSK